MDGLEHRVVHPIVIKRLRDLGCLYFLHVWLNELWLKNLVARRSFGWVHLEQVFYYSSEILAVEFRQFRVWSWQNCSKQAIHVGCFKGRAQCCHFVYHTAQRPNIALVVVRLIFPHLRTSIVWGSSLRVEHAILLSDFWHIQVAQFESSVTLDEHVGWL